MTKATIKDLSVAVGDLLSPAKRQLRELEELTYRQGIEPGPDLAFAGLRIVIARCEQAAKFLAELAPVEPEFRTWFAERAAKRVEPTAASPEAV